MNSDFTFLDRILSFTRFNKIKKYIPKNSVVCDLGCGYGKNLKKLKKMGLLKSGYGIDKNADETLKDNTIKYIKLDVTKNNLPLKTNSVDNVIMLAVIEHLKEVDAHNLLLRINKILKKNGVLIISTPSPASKPILEFLSFKLRLISQKQIYDHKCYYDFNKLSCLLKGIGLKIIKAKKFQLGLNSIFLIIKYED